MRNRNDIILALRMFGALLLVATTMAVSCPQPDPNGGGIDVVEPVETKSAERRQLESAYTEGLYLKGTCVLGFNLASFQRAANPLRKVYRIQSDDQKLYLHIVYGGDIPSAEGDDAQCEIHYRLAAGESTTLIVRMEVVKATEEYLWLWNEFQKVGVIVQRI